MLTYLEQEDIKSEFVSHQKIGTKFYQKWLIFENWLVTKKEEAYLLGAEKHTKDI